MEITAARLDTYAESRMADGASRATVNYELAVLRRAFRLAIEKGLSATMPVINLARLRNARSGFFEDGDFAAAQWEQRDSLFVFHRNGEQIKGSTLRCGWERACRRADLAGRLVHDLRRSAARDLRRAGVSEGEIMKFCGWRTRSMFDRYNIIDEEDLARAVVKRFGNGKQAENIPPAENTPQSVSSSST